MWSIAMASTGSTSPRVPQPERHARSRAHTVLLASASALAALVAAGGSAPAQSAGPAASACPGDNGGITLSPGFCATIFADNIGHVRHMVVAPNGVLYVNTWSGRYFRNVPPPPGGMLVALKDTSGNGRADKIERFGPSLAEGSAGGSGIAIYNGAVYAEQNDKIVRFQLPTDAAEIAPKGQSETVVSGMPLTGDHPMHPFVIDSAGHIYVDVGSATNACQTENRVKGSPGHDPCTELETRAGTWRYDANKTDQHFSAADRYATGIRNGEGFSFDASGQLYATQHGRDQLAQNWPKLYTVQQSAELPAEEVVAVKQGGDYGWPECYFDQNQKKLVLAPEYGGDGGHKVGVCADKTPPVAYFPGHWAPNDLLVYTGKAFPTAYQGGLFVAFHGSWNRAPLPQGGYDVAFQPMRDGKTDGDFIVFANGFAGAIREPGRAAFRPTGLAMGPDGSLYISDDVHGRIWRVTSHSNADAALAAAPSPQVAATTSGNSGPPEGIHPDAGRTDTASLPVPAGASKDEVALGDRIFHGEAAEGTCAGCHGSDAKGSPQAPSLVDGNWYFGDGSFKAIEKTVADGVPRPRNYSDPMPPKGGAQLSEQQVAAVSAYVWAISHRGGEGQDTAR